MIRIAVAVLTLSCVTMGLTGMVSAQPADTPWPMFQRDVRNTGWSPYLGPVDDTVQWECVLDSAVLLSSPVIGEDGTVYIGTVGGFVHAVCPSSGALKWKTDLRGEGEGYPIHGAPAVGADGTIYVAVDHTDHSDGMFYALNRNGHLKWSSPYDVEYPGASSPTIGDDGTIYRGSSYGSGVGVLYAFIDAGNYCQLKWILDQDSEGSKIGEVQAAPAIGPDGAIYIGTVESARSGTLRKLWDMGDYGEFEENGWPYYADTGGVARSSPTVGPDGQTVCVGANYADNSVHAVKDGVDEWPPFETGHNVSSSPAIGWDGTIYVGSEDGNFYALWPDLTYKWHFETGGMVRGSPAVDSSEPTMVYFGSDDGFVYALRDRETYAELVWSYETGGPVTSSPAIGADGTLYIGSGDGKLYAFWGPGPWTRMYPDPPDGRMLHAMAYDAESDVVILFGGYIGENQRADDTWAYDYNTDTWTELFPEVSPSARISHAMTYDAESDRIILFGGIQDGDDKMGDTWAYDYNSDTGGTWKEMNPSTHPEDRYGFAFAYDAESDLVILFGGRGQAYQNFDPPDTWWYDYNDDIWYGPFYPDPLPSPRRNMPMAYDAESDRCILFGGEDDAGHPMPGTWAYDQNAGNGGSWEERHPIDPPEDRCLHAMAYHGEIDRVVLFGGGGWAGRLDDTWAYDYNSDTWEEVTAEEPPCGRHSSAMAYDAESGVIVLFGGESQEYSYMDDTWSFTTSVFYAPYGWLWYGWNWIAIPAVPHDTDPHDILGFDCSGILWYWDKYGKSSQVYRPPFVMFEMMVGESYLLWLDEVPETYSYLGTAAPTPFEFRMGRMGWTWLGMPRLEELGGDDFMSTVVVEYPTGSGNFRTAQEDYDAIPNNWLSWGWPWWDPFAQAPRTFTPYAPWNNICYPWLGYRCWVQVGTSMNEDDPDQVTLIWP